MMSDCKQGYAAYDGKGTTGLAPHKSLQVKASNEHLCFDTGPAKCKLPVSKVQRNDSAFDLEIFHVLAQQHFFPNCFKSRL
jgi:hypothetical protein